MPSLLRDGGDEVPLLAEDLGSPSVEDERSY